MARVCNKSLRVTLSLNSDEVMYLLNRLQNAEREESQIEEEARSAIWCELNNCVEQAK